MTSLHVPTIFFINIFSNLICLVALYNLWTHNRKVYSGLNFWLAQYILNFVSITLIAVRGKIPDLLSIVAASLMLIVGIWMLLLGLRLFLGKPIRIFPHLYLVIVYALLQAYLTYITPSLQLRNILFSVFMAGLTAEITWLIWKKTDNSQHRFSSWTGYITLAYTLFALTRIVLDLLYPPGTNLLAVNGFEAAILLAFQILNISLTFSLVSMVNRRLQFDLEEDIADRTRAEKELVMSEEKFSKAFQSSPDAILITRMKDGLCIEVNDGFSKISGFKREEAIGKTTLMLDLWDDLQDRKHVVQTIATIGKISGYQFNVRSKSGKLIRAELAGEIIRIGDVDCMLTIIRDISTQQHVEEILHARLRLWEYSLDHTATEVMHKSLDEIELLTGSKISFYHMVEEDQNNLTLFAWSKATTETFCKAEGAGMHYSVNDAGVWADSIRERKPVIHNDYASLANRKGLPDGHSPIQRELVVPIFRDDKIVSVLGVGNKPTDYTEQDVELVEFISELVWTMVAQKQAEEKIHLLNEKLEKMVMTDELTRLPNRRSFFEKGKEEITRVHRYPEPFSMIMLDIDRFKRINDTYGHDAGDRALQSVAKILEKVIREVDHAARLGGEEFGILLPNTGLQAAHTLADRLRREIETTPCKFQDQQIWMTASLGVAEYLNPATNFDELFHYADTALYQAKNHGRNQVIMYSESPLPSSS